MTRSADLLSESVNQFRVRAKDIYDVERDVNMFVRELMVAPGRTRSKTLEELRTSGDPVLAAFARRLDKALAGEGRATVSSAADKMLKTLENKDPVVVEKPFVSKAQHKALERALTKPPKDPGALNIMAQNVAGPLPDEYKKA